MSRRVYLHIGAPKTGTTYLQERLALNAPSLARHGVVFPTRGPLAVPSLFHFRAALDLLDGDWGGKPGHARGAWAAMLRRVRRAEGTVVISHETLAPAPAEVIARALGDLRALGDTDVHVVYSARDLGRQIPAAWQEHVKQGGRASFRRYLERVEDGRAWFSQAFDVPRVLGAWSADVAPDHVHVVTVPRRGVQEKRSDVLWLRFCEVLGIHPDWAPLDTPSRNRSLGIAETQLIRRLNRRVDTETRASAPYDKLIRERLAQGELANRESTTVRLPPRMYPWAVEQSERWVEWIETSGVHVVGDLKELRPVAPPVDQGWYDPDKVTAKALHGPLLDALAVMTAEAARRPDPELQPVARARDAAIRLRRPGLGRPGQR